MGTTRIPATAAIADPNAQFSTAILLGDNPMAEAERSLSDTASVARPELTRSVEQPETERGRAPDGQQDQPIDRDPDVAPQRHSVRLATNCRPAEGWSRSG